MTRRDADDETLRTAFQSLSETVRKEPSPEEIERVWEAVCGELPADERRALVDRIADDPGLAEAWRVAQDLWRASSDPAPSISSNPAQSVARRERQPWLPRWLGAAAALLVAVAIGAVFHLLPSSTDETFRSPRRPVVESLVDSDVRLPRDAFWLRWTPGPAGSRYHVRVTTEDLRVLTTVTDLARPELMVERELLSDVAPGARVFWQVDVRLPSGETVSSHTFVVSVQ